MDEEIKEPSVEKKDDWEKNRKKDFYIEIILMLILGVLIGVAVKTEAAKRITIGSDDYKMKFFPNTYNLNNLEKELSATQAAAQEAAAENPESVVPTGETPPAAN